MIPLRQVEGHQVQVSVRKHQFRTQKISKSIFNNEHIDTIKSIYTMERMYYFDYGLIFLFGIMIAKGRTVAEAEIEFMYNAYKSLIDRIDLSYKEDIQHIEKLIQQIETDTAIEYEEKRSELDQYDQTLDTLIQQRNNSYIALFCGIYSFWEKSLNVISKYYKVEFYKKDGSINYAPRITDYLKELLDKKNYIPKVLLTGWDELRNYFTHGTLSPKRKSIIESISKKNVISVQENCGDFIIESASDLHKTLDVIYSTLKDIQSYKQNSCKHSKW